MDTDPVQVPPSPLARTPQYKPKNPEVVQDSNITSPRSLAPKLTTHANSLLALFRDPLSGDSKHLHSIDAKENNSASLDVHSTLQKDLFELLSEPAPQLDDTSSLYWNWSDQDHTRLNGVSLSLRSQLRQSMNGKSEPTSRLVPLCRTQGKFWKIDEQSVPMIGTSQDDSQKLLDGGWDWYNRGTSHVELSSSDALPLVQGEFLGYGVHGPVHATMCNGRLVAWKRKFCRAKVRQKDKEEINILKKLQHPHIIQLIGTYTQGSHSGLLLYPVTVTDLGTFLEDVDHLRHPLPDHADEQRFAKERLSRLGVDLSTMCLSVLSFLRRNLGCLTNAVAYLHQNSVRHKDLKPPNILLNLDRLYLTDFGTATDFSMFSQSVTDNGDRGTPKYFSPEAAAWEPSGRSPDIFSLGCIFLEMLWTWQGYSLQEAKQLRANKDGSFQANLMELSRWKETTYDGDQVDKSVLDEVWKMLHARPESRPTIQQIAESMDSIEPLLPQGQQLYSSCCVTSLADMYVVSI